ncbi:aminotransferase class V-fold PLP-dependent enzyme [Halorussus pelagicus]|uniref:aminotransferase class V-fold PLP-dependent enzyme n=1 Tax=Halorussus pelagicus TaxID=2505977 RepID=UPI000FFBA031|nr:aminotransferase class V-fold PLP-dependent enzyme [Halorussus pelagicus]
MIEIICWRFRWPAPPRRVGTRQSRRDHRIIGYETIRNHIETLTDRVKGGIEDSETARLLSPREYESGLVTFAVEDPNAEAFVEALAGDGDQIRSLPFLENAVRASVYVFKTEADVDELVTRL